MNDLFLQIEIFKFSLKYCRHSVSILSYHFRHNQKRRMRPALELRSLCCLLFVAFVYNFKLFVKFKIY